VGYDIALPHERISMTPDDKAKEPNYPAAVEVYTVSQDSLDKTKAFLRESKCDTFVRGYESYFEVAVMYGPKRKTAAAEEVHRRMAAFSITEKALPIHITFSLYEVLRAAEKEGVAVLNFRNQDQTYFSVVARGTPLRLERFWKVFAGHLPD
jgi:hypothetical protein